MGGEVNGWRGEVRVDDGYRSEKFTATEHLLKIIKGSASSTQSTVASYTQQALHLFQVTACVHPFTSPNKAAERVG